MNNDYIIILDIETTGFSPSNGDEITEIGALKIDATSLEIVDEFQCLIEIQGHVNSFIEKFTGISNDLLRREGINPLVAFRSLSNFCNDLDIYAHNYRFDKRFIRYFLDKYSIRYTPTN